eukprot:gene9682-10669_t
MAETTAYIGVVSGLLAILLLLTVLLAVFVWFKSKLSAKSKLRKKRPKLKIQIKDLPKTTQQPPSAAYQILSSNNPPEFTIPPTPVSGQNIPDSPRFPHKFFSYKSTEDSESSLPQSSDSLASHSPKSSHVSATLDQYYRRSASVPNDVYLGRNSTSPFLDHTSSSLWRSAITKTVAANLLTVPLRRNRINAPINGLIKFCLKYNVVTMELFVKVLDLIDLPLTKEKGVSYPYIQVYIVNDNEDKPPLFYEVLNFTREKTCNFTSLTISKIRSSTLRFVVLDFDKFSKSEFVADVTLPLEHVNLDGEEETRPLRVSTANQNKEKGELCISLSYQPNSSQVSVIVMKGAGLPDSPNGGQQDYFVKITLLRDGLVNDKRRTRIVKKNRSPVFNEKLVFPVDEHGLRSICLVFDLIHYESRLKQEKIGNVVIGNNCSSRAIGPLELKHFHEMLDCPQKQIAESHKVV